MSETWKAFRTSINRLKQSLSEADEDTRWNFGFWVTGFAAMGVAIIIAFGWAGVLFCFGATIWTAGKHALRAPE